MSRLRLTIVAVSLAAGLVVPAAIPVLAQDSPSPSPSPTTEATAGTGGGAGGDTGAIAINTKDGSDIFRIAFAIKRAMGDVVDNGNAAVAFASCTDCETVAVSIQVVLMMNDPSVVTPTNLAIAINQECTLCVTLASAYQVILTTDGPVRFTPAGLHEIAAIRRELLAMRHAGLTIEEILARLDQLMDRFYRVLTEEMIDVGSPPEGSVQTPASSPGGEASVPPDVTPSPTSSPSSIESPSPEPEPSPSPTTSPSASP
jgi:putative peptide zinc metalloprotease protein